MGTPFPNSVAVQLPPGPPIVCTIIDVEEDFDWGRPFQGTAFATHSVRNLGNLAPVLAPYGIVPSLLVTFPTLQDSEALAVLRTLQDRNGWIIGAQLHPWVNPPFDEPLDNNMSYPGNLPAAVEAAKIRTLNAAIKNALGHSPTIYKAGRYGFGPNTARIIEDEGFTVDTSLMPHTNYSRGGGPDFSKFDSHPFWFGNSQKILELPVTRRVIGLAADRFTSLYEASSHSRIMGQVAPYIFAKLGLLERITLSPEGNGCHDMMRLAKHVVQRRHRLLSLSFHSTSLVAGANPYTRTKTDLHRFYDELSCFLHLFQTDLGGKFLSALDILAALRGSLEWPADK